MWRARPKKFDRKLKGHDELCCTEELDRRKSIYAWTLESYARHGKRQLSESSTADKYKAKLIEKSNEKGRYGDTMADQPTQKGYGAMLLKGDMEP